MKQPQHYLKFIGFIALIIVMNLTFVSLANAQTTGKGYADKSANATEQDRKAPEFSDAEIDQFRQDMLNYVDAVRDVASVSRVSVMAEKELLKARAEFNEMSNDQLRVFRKTINNLDTINDNVKMVRFTIASFKQTPAYAQWLRDSAQANTSGFPSVGSPICSPVSESGLVAADAIYFTAETVREAASRACDEVIVVLGEGGNLSLVCLVTDAVFVVAKTVNYGLHVCDDSANGLKVDALVDRAAHIHDDLEKSVTNDNNNKTAIINNDNTNKTTIVNNDNTNTSNIMTNDNTNTSNIMTNDNTNTAKIMVNDNTNTGSLTNMILRTQIEADLALADTAPVLGLYATPNARGGYLDLVATIVSQTITNVSASGGTVSSAQTLLGTANQQKVAGQYRTAYISYRKAYKAAILGLK